MKTLKVNLGGKLPENATAVCIFLEHENVLNGDHVFADRESLMFHRLEVKPRGDLPQSDEDWQEWVKEDRQVEVQLPCLDIMDGVEVTAVVVQPGKDIEAILVVTDGVDTHWYDLPEKVKIDLINY